MWFKNLQIFRLQPGTVIDVQKFAEQLAKHPLIACGGLERERVGWSPVRGGNEALHYEQDGKILINFGVEQKILPAAVVKQEAEKKVAEIAEAEGYRPGAKRRREIREQIEEDLLPRAFAKRSHTHAYLDPAAGWLVVDASSTSKAEAVVKLLGETMPDLQVSLLGTQCSPGAAMTGWLAGGEAPAGFSIDRDGELRLPGEDRATVRYVRHALDGEEIGEHIASGKQVTRLGMTWADRISFVLTEKKEVKRLQFLDVLTEQSQQAEDAEAMFQVEFALMTGEAAKLLADLVEALGGEEA